MAHAVSVDPVRLKMIAVQRFGSVDALGSFLLSMACHGIPEGHIEKFNALWEAYQQIREEDELSRQN